MGLVRKFRAMVGSDLAGEPSDGTGTSWQLPYETLRKRWNAVPTTREIEGVQSTKSVLELADGALLAAWDKARLDITTGPEFAHRGWYHTLYADSMRGKKLMDVGSGFGVDSLTFAQHGAKLTFVDLVESNLKVLERLCKIMGLKDVQFVLLEDLESLRPLNTDYDVIMAMGSMHHAPLDILKPEYRKARWVRDGRPRFAHWGVVTDGEGTPWAEWLDVEKLLAVFGPAKFDVVLYQEFHNSDFNWFDLLYRGMPDSRP
jgi:hypothetical protein